MSTSYTRRQALTGAAILLTGAAVTAQEKPASKKLKVVVAGGHPGDPEYGCGGTIARYTDEGHKVTLLYLNRGEKGCGQQTAEACSSMRSVEAQQACRILGAQPLFAAQTDGEATINSTTYEAFRQLLAAENPDVVFTQWPIDNHRDHRAVSLLVYDAWLCQKKSFRLYYYEVSDGEDTLMFSPTDYVDISASEARKHAACYAHASQSPDRYYSLQSQITRTRGIESGFTQAEAFIRHVESKGNILP